MIATALRGDTHRPLAVRNPAPKQVLTMEVEYKRLFCPHCRSFLLEAHFEGAAAVRVKCRQCTRRANQPVLVVIEIKLAVIAPPALDSAIEEPIERDSTPSS